MQTRKMVRLTESALMIALATVLSVVKLVDLPYGGSVTAASMLPILLIAYRYGVRWGLFTGLVHGILQLFLGVKNIIGVSFGAVVIILLFDYLVAFTVLGLGGLFRRPCKRQQDGLAAGALIGCVLRYVCHVISGCTVWAEYNYTSLPTFAYSAVYNATYMLPETLITVLAAYYMGSLLDFRGESVTRMAPQEKRPDVAVLLSGIGSTLLLGAAAYDLISIFSRMQDPETGLFRFESVAGAPWLWMLGITAAALALALVFRYLASRVPADSKTDLHVLFELLPFAAVIFAVAADGLYVKELLEKAASKAELAPPFTSGGAFAAAMGAMGMKYGLPALAATLCVILLAVLVIVRAVRKSKKGK